MLKTTNQIIDSFDSKLKENAQLYLNFTASNIKKTIIGNLHKMQYNDILKNNINGFICYRYF